MSSSCVQPDGHAAGLRSHPPPPWASSVFPSGVVHTHRGLHAQTSALIDAWGWQAKDHILHTLPLHHVHGIVVAMLCGLQAGAAVEFMPRFSPSRVWERVQVRVAVGAGLWAETTRTCIEGAPWREVCESGLLSRSALGWEGG